MRLDVEKTIAKYRPDLLVDFSDRFERWPVGTVADTLCFELDKSRTWYGQSNMVAEEAEIANAIKEIRVNRAY